VDVLQQCVLARNFLSLIRFARAKQANGTRQYQRRSFQKKVPVEPLPRASIPCIYIDARHINAHHPYDSNIRIAYVVIERAPRPIDPVDSTSYNRFAGWSSPVARWAHNPKVVGSNPTPATKESISYRRRFPKQVPVIPQSEMAPPDSPSSLKDCGV
jgi:hypothetical protein